MLWSLLNNHQLAYRAWAELAQATVFPFSLNGRYHLIWCDHQCAGQIMMTRIHHTNNQRTDVCPTLSACSTTEGTSDILYSPWNILWQWLQALVPQYFIASETPNLSTTHSLYWGAYRHERKTYNTPWSLPFVLQNLELLRSMNWILVLLHNWRWTGWELRFPYSPASESWDATFTLAMPEDFKEHSTWQRLWRTCLGKLCWYDLTTRTPALHSCHILSLRLLFDFCLICFPWLWHWLAVPRLPQQQQLLSCWWPGAA